MSGIMITGWGAVSPAGWGAKSLFDALEKGEGLPTKSLAWPGNTQTLAVREVPVPQPRPAFLAHPRLRRASAITHYSAASVLEALDMAGRQGPNQPERLGLIMCMMAGCVQYSHRFFDETLKDPSTASPLVFPETVFNAPGSHVAALLGRAPVTYTLLGDAGTYIRAMALAAEWLEDGRVDGCLVVGAEETNWLLASVLWYYNRHSVLGGGAGTLYLERRTHQATGILLNGITDAHEFSSGVSRVAAAREMRCDLPPCREGELLCDSRQNITREDQPEIAAWQDWTGRRISPKSILGEGLMASGAWQCVAACHQLSVGAVKAANVSVVGANQQAIGARLEWASPVEVHSGNP